MLHLHTPLPYALDDPHEQGGLLFGTYAGQHVHVTRVTGVLPKDQRGPRHLTMLDPGHLTVAEDADRDGLTYLGYWHSHPTGTPPIPSEVDVTDWQVATRTMTACPFLVFPIMTGGVLRVWRLRPGQSSPEEVPWTQH